MKAVFDFFESKSKFFLLMFPLYWALHIPVLDEPPRSVHVWRQCNTSAVARNFVEESMNIFKPRVDRRRATDGVTGMQFPSFEFSVAMAAKIIGYSDWLPRVINLLIFCLGLWLSYSLFLEITQNKLLAAIGTWTLAWSPDLFYHSANALPDILALVCGISGLLFFLKWEKSQSIVNMVMAVLFMTLAGLTKLQFLAFGCPIAAVVLRNLVAKKYSRQQLTLVAAFGFVSIMLPLWWYWYSVGLIEESGLRDFGIRFNPITSLAQALDVLVGNVISDLPELLLNYAGFAFFLLGIFAFFKRKGWKGRDWFWPMALWATVLVTYHIIELGQMIHHGYYMIPYLVPLAVIVCYGARFIYHKLPIVLLLLLILQPVFATTRIYSRWVGNKTSVPVELYESELRKKLESAVRNDARCIVGPDESGCVYFYFLHKKGFGFASVNDLLKIKNGELQIESWIEEGAEYLYSNDQAVLKNKKLQGYFSEEIEVVGNFKVIQLKTP